MAIDLNACIGCNACVVACQAENNIPVVGKEQVRARPRDALDPHRPLLRRATPDDPRRSHHQPVPCMHCENAPCEVVCPVAATVHSDEGLNDMVYNRCVGTRYCSNNCPYKVRRFNFFLYQDWDDAQRSSCMRNPDVTVRSRGVMEKCTYCVQRIKRRAIDARERGPADRATARSQTACQQACPAEAIVFGDLNDPTSRGREAEGRAAQLRRCSTELNTRPRTTYLAAVQQPEPGARASRVAPMARRQRPTPHRRRDRPTRRSIEPGHTTSARVTDKISAIVLHAAHAARLVHRLRRSRFALLHAAVRARWPCCCSSGIGIWGINVPVGWGFDIINFVWWIGIGHAGTLISAILLLLRQEWRTSINRFAEAMTLFAVACAGLFPLFHIGRPWLAPTGCCPYPNTMGLWPKFRSPLVWDVFAVSTYATVSLLFWYVGLIPDLATLRDRAQEQGLARSSTACWRWAGAARPRTGTATRPPTCCWPASRRRSSSRCTRSCSFDFAVGIVPGWHATIFPPYFVAGAIFAGFAMVLTLAIPLRKCLRPRGLHHDAAPREHGARSCSRPA